MFDIGNSNNYFFVKEAVTFSLPFVRHQKSGLPGSLLQMARDDEEVMKRIVDDIPINNGI